ncbi:MAG: dockerin type I repeat-containing protein, partial [Prevotella sp.]|nr:dockerin type I repeat-containing protein [Prevotella sp.]
DVWKEFFMDGDDRDTWLAMKLLQELTRNLEAIGGYDLAAANETLGNAEATKEDYENGIAQLQQQIRERCSNAVDGDLPVDATGLITNPSFTINTNAYWQGDTPQFQKWNNAEFYETTFNIHQQLTGLPNGNYLLKVKGFHRPGSNQDVFNDYLQGTDNARAQLYANDESVTLVNQANCALDNNGNGGAEVTSDGTTCWVPNSMEEAYRWFNNSCYENELPVTITDGSLFLGIRLDKSVDWGWVIFDDFRLYYLGSNIDSSLALGCEMTSLHPGSTATLSVSLDIDDENQEGIYEGYQFDLFLPNGIALVKEGGKFKYELSDRYSGPMQVGVSDFGDGHYRVLVFSTDKNLITGTEGNLISLSISADSETGLGTYPGEISNFLLSRNDGKEVGVSDLSFDIKVTKAYPMGDVNHDGHVTVADVMATVSKVLGSPVNPFYPEQADVNNDGSINITDIIGIVDIVLYTPTSMPMDYRTAMGRIVTRTTRGGYSLSLEGNEHYTALQMTVTLPEGATLTGVSLSGGNTSHKVMHHQVDDNKYNVVVWTNEGEAFRETQDLIRLAVVGDRGRVTISDILLTNDMLETIVLPDADNIEGTETGVGSFADNPSERDYYNIQGMKVTQPKRGIYIQGHRKVNIK